MKYRTIALLGIILGLATAPALTAQDYVPEPVRVSTEKVLRDGKEYLVHPVLERQTLFSIAKAYGVTLDDLYAANPGLLESGLKKDETILVPLPGPAAVQQPAFRQHTVKWYESIEDIAAQYGVTVQDIMDANHLTTRKITKRQVLQIPVRGASVQPAAQEGPTDVREPAGEVVPEGGPAEEGKQDDGREEPSNGGLSDILDWFTGKGRVEMALLMPFEASGKASETNMDFYSGVLMALRDLEAEGVKSTLNVYDLQEGVPAASTLEKNDFILGPVSVKDLTNVLERLDGRTPVVSPLDQRAGTLADTHAGFIQAPSSTSSQYAGLAAWVKEEAATGDKVILVTEKVSGGTAPATGIREALLGQGVTFEGASWTQAEGRSMPESLSSRVVKGAVNRIIVASEKEAFIGDVVRNLGILQGKGYKIVMYAPSRVRNFETVDGSAYHQNELHICSTYFVDYGTESVDAFVSSYRALYRTEPSQFAFQGYDLTRFFAGLCAKYGNRWTHALSRITGSGLHTDFRFEKAGDGSYRNTGIRRIVYRTDYTTELVRP